MPDAQATWAGTGKPSAAENIQWLLTVLSVAIVAVLVVAFLVHQVGNRPSECEKRYQKARDAAEVYGDPSDMYPRDQWIANCETGEPYERSIDDQ